MADVVTEEIVVDFGKICRLCLTEDEVLISLYSTDCALEKQKKSIPEKILELMAIKVSKDDGFPSWICHNCLSQVDRCTEFFDMCRSSQSTLNESYVKALSEVGLSVSTLKNFIQEKGRDPDKIGNSDEEVLVKNEDECSTGDIKTDNGWISDEVQEKCDYNDVSRQTYFCRDCTKVYTNVNEFLVHRISIHHDDLVTESTKLERVEGNVAALWICEVCGSKFHSRSAVSAHLKCKHNVNEEKEPSISLGKLIYCKYCGSSFSRKQLRRHLQVVHRIVRNLETEHFESDSLDCKICYRPFTRQSSLRNHIEKFHNDSLEMVAEAGNCDIVWKCNECDLLLTEEVFLMQHYGEKHLKYPLEVDSLRVLISKSLICHCGVINSSAIDAFIHEVFYHKQEEDKKSSLECMACFNVFTQLHDLKKHIISFHWFITSYENECAFCCREFSSKESLRIHLDNEHDVRLYSIPSEEACISESSKTCNNEGGSVEIIEIIDEESSSSVKEKCLSGNVLSNAPSVCDFCGETYVKEGAHSHECRVSLSCEICGKMYESSKHLNKHVIEYHNSLTPIKCPLCPKVFPRKLNLHNHYKRRHLKQTKKFVCSYCGVSLKGKVALRSHEDRLHRNIRNYKCTECPEAFTTRSILRKHAQRHLANRPMLQCQYCERKFSTISGIERHVKTHGGVKDFVCDVPMCGKSFYTKSELKRHTKFHTKDFKHDCPICGHKFMTPGELKKHSTKHTGERPFKCHLCSCAYSRRDDKVKHLKRVHNLKVKRVYGKPLRKYSDDKNDELDTIVVDEEKPLEVTAKNDVIYSDITIIE